MRVNTKQASAGAYAVPSGGIMKCLNVVLGKKEAAELIQKYIDSISDEKEYTYDKSLYRLVELDMEDAYEKKRLKE